MSSSKRIEVITFIILLGFSISVFFHFVTTYYLSLPYPINTFTFTATDRFMDFFNPVRGSADLDPFNVSKADDVGGYPPFAYFVSFLFYLLHNPVDWISSTFFHIFNSFSKFVFSFLFFLVSSLTALIYFMVRMTGKIGESRLWYSSRLFVLVFLSYPVLFAIDRGNFDLLICAILAAAIFFFQKKHFTISAILIGIATAMKIYPVVFLILFFPEKKYREIVLSCLIAGAANLISLAVFKGGFFIQLDKFIFTTTQSYTKYLVNIFRFSSSPYTFFIAIFPENTDFSIFKNVYLIFDFVLLLFYFCLILIKKPDFWKQCMIITLLIFIIPWSTTDYRLMLLLIPLALYFRSENSGRMDWIIAIISGLLLIPKNYYTIRSDLNIGMIVNPILILALLVTMTINILNFRITSRIHTTKPA